MIDDTILVERKTQADFVASLIDGRLFPQVARLAHSPYRSVMLIEGPLRTGAPVHPHFVQGALVSIAAMWRLPVLHSTDPDESFWLLRFLADQGSESRQPVLPRYDRKPERLAARRLFVLQGLPGIGPELARRLLSKLGSVARVMTADAAMLEQVRGVGPKKAARIRERSTARRTIESAFSPIAARPIWPPNPLTPAVLEAEAPSAVVATSDIMWFLWLPWRSESASES